MLKSAKSQYLTDLCESSKGNSKQFWSHFRYLSTKGTKSNYNNDTFTADDINDYFLSVPYRTVQSVPSTSLSPLSFLDRSEAVFQMSTVDVDKVASILTSLDSTKATGCDKLSVKFIKACPLAMARLLTRVINQSISSCIFPSSWKYAVVTPVPKSKNNSALTNYRPISVLPVFSKILERVIHDQLVSYFLQYDLFSPYQSGFRPCHSTQDVLLYVVDSWRKEIDARKFVVAGFLDLAKAFDCVNHDILLDKLARYGVVNNAYAWFESYLCGRQQAVKFDGCLSAWGPVRIGVPQGSILGPLLFSIFVNDLPSVVNHAQINMFADDTELHCSGEDLPSVQNDLQSDLHRVQNWLQANRLQLNISKSVMMLIGSWQKLRNRSVSVSIDGKPLASVTSTRYLGVLIDQHLTWKLHVDNVLKRVRCKLYALYRLKPLPGHLLFRLYQAFVLPVFDYCDVVWAPSAVSLSKPLERLHSRFLQQIPDCHSFVRVTLSERRRFHTAVQVFKVLYQLCPGYLNDWFVFAEAYTGHSGRNKFRLFIPQINTSIGKNGFFYRGAVIWNNLTPVLFTVNILSNFKALFKRLYS